MEVILAVLNFLPGMSLMLPVRVKVIVAQRAKCNVQTAVTKLVIGYGSPVVMLPHVPLGVGMQSKEWALRRVRFRGGPSIRVGVGVG